MSATPTYTGVDAEQSRVSRRTFKTVAIASPVPGVCHGYVWICLIRLSHSLKSYRICSFFTYKNDCEESDIELLTSFFNTGNTYVQPGLQLTNQNLQCDHTQNTHTQVAYPADPTAGEHEVSCSPYT